MEPAVAAAGGPAYVDPSIVYRHQSVERLVMHARMTRQQLVDPVYLVTLDLVDVLIYVLDLGTEATVNRDLAIQRQAPNVVVAEKWRSEVVELAVTYAWHDVEPMRKTRDDLARTAAYLLQASTGIHYGPGIPGPSLKSLMENARRTGGGGGGS